MVIGHGMLATSFAAYAQVPDVCVFASGVSNSKTRDELAFQREEKLLRATLTTHSAVQFLYFSTCSIYDPAERDSAYCQHKLRMEALIQELSQNFIIFRVSQILGHSSNPNTLINFLLHTVTTGQHFELWEDAYRNIIGIDEVVRIVDYIVRLQPFPNRIINIACPYNLTVREVVECVEHYTGRKALYSNVPKGAGNYPIDTTAIQPILQELGITFPSNYLTILLHQFFGDTLSFQHSIIE